MRAPRNLRAHVTCAGLAAALIFTIGHLVSALPAAARQGPRNHRFDGFRLGDSYASVFARAPYSKPCDDDPVDHRRRRAMVYGALPCRGLSFPEQTTVVIFLAMNAPGAPWAAQPIEALAWLHGSYFRKRSRFPVHPGDRLSTARRALGRSLAQMPLKARRLPAMTAYRFAGDVHVLAEGELVRGVVVGAMPQDAENEQWRVILQMLRRYTPPTPKPTTP